MHSFHTNDNDIATIMLSELLCPRLHSSNMNDNDMATIILSEIFCLRMHSSHMNDNDIATIILVELLWFHLLGPTCHTAHLATRVPPILPAKHDCVGPHLAQSPDEQEVTQPSAHGGRRDHFRKVLQDKKLDEDI